MDFLSCGIICPFYKREKSRNSFSCEGSREGHYILQQFLNPAIKKEYQERYCMSFNYCECMTAKALLELYDDKK